MHLFYTVVFAYFAVSSKPTGAYTHVASKLSPRAHHTNPLDEATPNTGREKSDITNLFLSIPEEVQAGCMAGATIPQRFKVNGAMVANVRKVGAMPEGYFNGMILNFARHQCERNETPKDSALQTITSPALVGRDTLAHYKNSPFGSLLSGDPLIDSYALMMPLGMMESSGKYKDGIDRLTSNTKPGNTVEAGLFQVSQNSINNHQVPATVYAQLVNKYRANPGLCAQDVFSVGLGTNPETQNLGQTESQISFQRDMKQCPALAVDYMAVLLRKDFRHNGPLKRFEARPRAECVLALKHVQSALLSRDKNENSELCNVVRQPTSSSNFGSRDYINRMSNLSRTLPAKQKNYGQISYDTSNGRHSYQDHNGTTHRGSVFSPTDSQEYRAKFLAKEQDNILKSLNDSAETMKQQISELTTKISSLESTNMPEDRAELIRLKHERNQLTQDYQNLLQDLQKTTNITDENAQTPETLEQEIKTIQDKIKTLTAKKAWNRSFGTHPSTPHQSSTHDLELKKLKERLHQLQEQQKSLNF